MQALARSVLQKAHCHAPWGLHRAVSTHVQAQRVVYHQDKRVLEVAFTNGNRFTYPAELLRVESPAVDSQQNALGQPKVVRGRRYVGILQVDAVGSYAIRIKFDDLHSSGLFTWSYLHELGVEKYARIKQYLKRLKASGGSRSPPTSTGRGQHFKCGSSSPPPAASR